MEDEQLVAMDLEMQLHSFGYDVVGMADTGIMALQLVEATRPDLILMDLSLRGSVDGVGIASRLQRSGNRTPIVFVTAYGSEEALRRAEAVCCSGYLTKPFRPEELRELVLRVLQQEGDPPSRILRNDAAALGLRFWTMLVLTGVATGVAGGLLMRLLTATEHTAFRFSSGELVAGASHTSPMRRFLVLALAGCVASAAGWAAGRLKGDTDLDGALWLRTGRLPVLKASVRAVYSIVVVGMGAAVGRENALKQAGGITGNLALHWHSLPEDQQRLLVACGAGAGMAAAYNVPLGGALFALEVLLGSFSLRAVLPAFATAFLSTWVSWLFLPNRPTYFLPGSAPTLPILGWTVLAGPICGLLAVPLVRLFHSARSGHSKGWQAAALPLVSLVVLGVIAMKLPAMLGNGKDVVQMSFLAEPATGMLLVLLLLRPLLTAAILRSGVPGGLFTPTMTFGAVTGLLLGRAWNCLVPMHASGPQPLFSFLGAGAVLAAATQGPVSSLAFMVELTHADQALIVPLLLAIVSATVTMRLMERRSIYSLPENRASVLCTSRGAE